MDFRRADLDDEVEMTAVADLSEVARQADAPFQHPRSVRMVTAEDRYGWDLEPDVAYVGHDDGALVARGTMHTSEWDNKDLAWFGVTVHPDHRRRGHGTQMLRCLELEAVTAGRSLYAGDAWDGSPGIDFLVEHGYDKKSRAILRRQILSEISSETVERLYAEAMGRAGEYELLRLDGALPDELLVPFCRMAESINDAPLDDLELEDDNVDPRRMRDHEHAMSMRGLDSYRVVARHRRTGELAGHTSVLVERWSPTVGHQEDTTVTPAHRGHRLGLALKTDMLRWLAEREPQLRTIDTWNTETNHPMIAINEELGYRMIARELEFQKRV